MSVGEVVRPADAAGVAEVLRDASERARTVSARGAGTKSGWGGALSPVDIWLETGELSGIVMYEPGDRVVTVRAGTTLRELQAELAAAGQRFVTTSGFGGATVGGVLSTNEAGPLRLRHGSARDLILGVEFVRADGVVAHSGGRVVKNVAGYDLGRLLCGAYGTLGVITQATLRLHPIPPARAWVVARFDEGKGPTSATLASRAFEQRTLSVVQGSLPHIAALAQSPAVAPSAIECDLPGAAGGELAVLVEGTPEGVTARVQALRSLLSEATGSSAEAAARSAELTVQDEPPSWWGSYPFADGGFGLKLSAPLDELTWAMTQLRDRIGSGLRLRGSVAAGVVHAGALPTTPVDDVVAALAAVRARLAGTSGNAVVVTAPSSTLDQLDAWGPVAGLELMRRVKAQFDPHGRFAAGRFVGGL